jgi:hypothetical protein
VSSLFKPIIEQNLILKIVLKIHISLKIISNTDFKATNFRFAYIGCNKTILHIIQNSTNIGIRENCHYISHKWHILQRMYG